MKSDFSVVKIPYGIKDGKYVHITEVERGLACGAVCIDCTLALEAHLGKKNLPYFKHKNKSSKCSTSLESIMHKIAKEIINQKKVITLPPVINGSKQIHPALKINIDKVELEHKLECIIPDILCQVLDKELLIEIKVTNPINTAKRKKIEELGIATIEISLKKELIYKNPIEIADQIINTVENKKWIYNKKTILYDQESLQYKRFLKEKSNLRPWKEKMGYPTKQVHCLNVDLFYKLVSRYKADLYKNCRKCEYYVEHDLNGVYCLYGCNINQEFM